MERKNVEMSAQSTEQIERTLLRHPPVIWPIVFLTMGMIVTVIIVIYAATSPNVSAEEMVITAIVSQAIYAVCVLIIILFFNNIARITTTKVIKYKMFPWRDHEEISLRDIKDFYKSGWFFVVDGSGHRIKFFCPPIFAPRIISTLRGHADSDLTK